ncbi:MAG TPA: hypothetical protein VJT84_12885 [Gaiellaceae bacterium]|nr:hypothetical protein [Gaiellaceae bacterium]
MKTVLDVLGVAIYVIAVIGLAAAVTAAMVRISPTRDKPQQPTG